MTSTKSTTSLNGLPSTLGSYKGSVSSSLSKRLAAATKDFTLNKLDREASELYGRDAEISRLHNVYKTCIIQQKSKALISMGGPSGSGKSLLASVGANQLCQMRTTLNEVEGLSSRAFLCQGKFYSRTENQSYTAIAAAISSLVDQIVEANEMEVIRGIRSALSGEIVSILKVLAPRITKLFHLNDSESTFDGVLPTTMGLPEIDGTESSGIDDLQHHRVLRFKNAVSQPKPSFHSMRGQSLRPTPEDNNSKKVMAKQASTNSAKRQLQQSLSSTEDDSFEEIDFDRLNEQRARQLQFGFSNLIAAVAKPSHPLIILLDDMQWADEASIQLLESLLTGRNSIRSLLVVTTFRIDEIDDKHRYSCLLENLERTSTLTLEHVVLHSLDLEAVNGITSTALRSTPEYTLDLARVVFDKTKGNPFFVMQFLQALIDDAQLSFEFGLMQWKWRLDDIRLRKSTDNVADLMKNRFRGFPEQEQEVIQVAAYLGEPFHLSVLSYIHKELTNCTSQLAERVIDHCIDEGLMIRDKETETLSFVHDQVGEAAWKIEQLGKPPHIPVLIGQMLLKSKSTDLTTDERHGFLVADLCNMDPKIVDRENWLEMANLNMKNGKVSLATGAYDSARKYFEYGLQFLGSDRWSTYLQLTVELHSAAADACYCGGALTSMESHLSAVLDRDDLPIEERVPAYLTRIRSYSSGHRFEEANEIAFAALRELNVLDLQPKVGKLRAKWEAFQVKRLLSGHNYESLTNLPMMENEKIMLALGLLDAVTVSGYIMSQELSEVTELISMRWTLTYGLTKFAPVHFCNYAMVCAVNGDREGCHMYADASTATMEKLGNYERCAKCYWSIATGALHWFSPMRDYIEVVLASYHAGMNSGDVEFASYCRMDYTNIKFFTGSEPLPSLLKEVEESCEWFRQCKQESAYVGSLTTKLSIQQLIYGTDKPGILHLKEVREATSSDGFVELFGTWDLQLKYYFGVFKDYGDVLDTHDGYLAKSRHVLFQALHDLACVDDCKGKTKGKCIRNGKVALKLMKKWTKQGSIQCLHQGRIIEAQLAALTKPKQAESLFQEAIKDATRCGHVQDKALAHELAGVFFLTKLRDDYWARYHIGQAIEWYGSWGAKAKVSQLEGRYKDILEEGES